MKKFLIILVFLTSNVFAENPLTKRFTDKDVEEMKKAFSEMGVNADDVKITELNTMGANAATHVQLEGDEIKLATFWADPNWWEKADRDTRRFLLGHEASHMLNKDNRWYQQAYYLSLGVYWMTAGTRLAEWEHRGSERMASGGYFGKIDALIMSAFALGFPIVEIFLPKKEEKRADIESATKLNCAKGGIKWLEEVLEENKKYREEGNFLGRLFKKLFISKEGNNRMDWEHPALTTRLEYLKELAENTEVELDGKETTNNVCLLPKKE